jgi:uncharacterized phage infection (PIP) family protein YhgE
MCATARVTSINVLPLLAAAIQKFRGEASNAVDDIDGEVRRALEWIHHDRKEYWAHEARLAQEAVSQAKLQLQQAMTMRRIADRDPSCIDEKRALERAKRRLERAQRKIQAVRHWQGALDRVADDLRRSRTQFDAWLVNDMSRAVAALNAMSESLVAYISVKPADETSDEESEKKEADAEAKEPAANADATAPAAVPPEQGAAP